MPAKKKPVKVASAMDQFMAQSGAKTGAVKAPTAQETAKNKQYAAYQQGANARAAAKAKTPVPAKKGLLNNITGFKARKALGRKALE